MRLVLANWKMNLGLAEAERWLAEFGPVPSGDGVTVVVLPSFPLLPLALARRRGFLVGAQNCGLAQSGPYTGEVSPRLLGEMGCTHVLLGHSERRLFFGESAELVARRTEAALAAGLRPVVCVGEGVGERRTEVLVRQLRPLEPYASAIAVAYEPVAAIGSGRPASVEAAGEARRLIQETLARDVPVLYGGSVSPENAAAFLDPAGPAAMQGLLVGTASLDPKSFGAIVEAARHAA